MWSWVSLGVLFNHISLICWIQESSYWKCFLKNPVCPTPLTVLCKSIEPRLVSICFIQKMSNRCRDLLNREQTYMKMQNTRQNRHCTILTSVRVSIWYSFLSFGFLVISLSSIFKMYLSHSLIYLFPSVFLRGNYLWQMGSI